MFKSKIVKFPNGYYAIQTWSIFGREYVDLFMPCFRWSKEDKHFYDCLTKNESRVREVYETLTGSARDVTKEVMSKPKVG